MALEITSIDELSADQVEQLQATFTQLVQERYPEIHLRTGVFHDLVAHFAGGISGAINQSGIDRLTRSGSLLEIDNDPALADDDLVDRVLSNYGVTRKAGEAAAGDISVTVGADTTVVIPSGLIFSTSGVNFEVDTAFTARPSTETASAPAERVLRPLGNGQFSFSITATAVEAGAQGNIRRGTQMTPAAPPQNFINAVAGTDFSGGRDTEVNAALLARLQEGIAAKVMQGRVNISALLKEQAAFADTLAYSVVGFGNAEMFRDRRGIIPISGGGRLDIYARTAPLPQTVTLLKEATLVAVTAEGGVWQFSISASEAPGFYEVVQVIRPDDPIDTAGFTVTSDVRGLDLPAGFAPDLIDATEGGYTKYQTAVVRFLDTQTATAGLAVGSAKAVYSVGVAAMPLIGQLQDFCLDPGVRNLASDVAVKAAVPCFLSVNFEVQIAAGSDAPDTAAIVTDLEATVNKLGFPGQLHASLIADVVHNYLADRQAVGEIDILGRIRKPGGGDVFIRSGDVLRIPDDPDNLVTGRTVAFILEKENVGVSVVAEGFTTGV